MTHWETLRQHAEDLGFKSQRWPLLWIKTHSCLNQAAQYNFTKNFEVALVLRKGLGTLIKPQASSYWLGTNTAERNLFHGHPFVKPTELWQWLAGAVALQGQIIGDPFSGVGSAPRSFLLKGYDIRTVELDEIHHSQQINVLSSVYTALIKASNPNAQISFS
jgi:hypothetical protein